MDEEQDEVVIFIEHQRERMREKIEQCKREYESARMRLDAAQSHYEYFTVTLERLKRPSRDK